MIDIIFRRLTLVKAPALPFAHDSSDNLAFSGRLRLGRASQEWAEQRLADEIAKVDADLERDANPRPRFADCAARYLAQSKDKRLGGFHGMARPSAYLLYRQSRYTPSA
jgi:hypothetical protein